MAEASKTPQDLRFMVAMIPPDVAAKITKAEMADRIIFASQLSRQASNAANRTLAKGFSNVAKAVLAADPRSDVATRHAQLMAKADAMPPGEHRDRLHRQAQRLLDDNPPAPTAQERTRNSGQVAKSGLVAVFDQQRRLAGVVAPSRIVQRVAKAKAADAPKMQVVFDQDGNLVGIVDPDDITPVTSSTGVAKPAAPGSTDSNLAAAAPDDVAKARRAARPRPAGTSRR